MRKKQLTEAEIEAEIAKLDLLPDAAARRETDALLKRLLTTPLEQFTPKVRRIPKRAR